MPEIISMNDDDRFRSGCLGKEVKVIGLFERRPMWIYSVFNSYSQQIYVLDCDIYQRRDTRIAPLPSALHSPHQAKLS